MMSFTIMGIAFHSTEIVKSILTKKQIYKSNIMFISAHANTNYVVA